MTPWRSNTNRHGEHIYKKALPKEGEEPGGDQPQVAVVGRQATSTFTIRSTRGSGGVAVGEAPVGGVAQLLVGRTVVVGGPGGAHDVHEVRKLRQTSCRLAMLRSVSMLSGTAGRCAPRRYRRGSSGTGRDRRVADDGQLLVHNHAKACEQRDLGAGQANSTRPPNGVGGVAGVGDVGVGQHAGGFEPGCHVEVDGDGVNGVGAHPAGTSPMTEVGRVLPMVTSPVRTRRRRGSRAAPSAETNPQTWEISFGSSCEHVASQLAADVVGVLTCLVGVEVVGEHAPRVVMVPYRGSLGLLAGVVAGLVQAPGVRAVNALLDVVEGCERQLDAGTNGVVQACVSGQDAEVKRIAGRFLPAGNDQRRTGETSD